MMHATHEVQGRITIAGAGNWLLASDRVGPRVLELVADTARRYGAEVELADLGCAGLALLDHLHAQELLLVVDACVGAGAPGSLTVVEPDLEQPVGGVTSVHQVGPLEALAVARHLYPERLPRRTLLLLVQTEGIDDQGLERACRAAAERIDAAVRSTLSAAED
jgi:hydrogenase maturation protease